MWPDWRWRHVAKSKWPILIGPWTSEVGFEVLYWLPWLTAWRAKYKIAKERLIAVSRGGAGIWYDAHRTIEICEYVSPDHLRRLHLEASQQQASVKQLRIRPFDQRLVDLVAQELGVVRFHLLHPSVMYHELAPWWGGDFGKRQLMARVAFAPVPVPPLPVSLALPPKYVAVRFYARHTWPMTDELKDWVSNLVERLAKRIPVVLLDAHIASDEHIDFPVSGPNILNVASAMTPQNNLGVQSAVIAHAQAFVGTYGGTMQLAVRLRKPAIGFYHGTFDGTAYEHKQLTEWLAVQQQTPVFIGRPDEASVIHEVIM